MGRYFIRQVVMEGPGRGTRTEMKKMRRSQSRKRQGRETPGRGSYKESGTLRKLRRDQENVRAED